MQLFIRRIPSFQIYMCLALPMLTACPGSTLLKYEAGRSQQFRNLESCKINDELPADGLKSLSRDQFQKAYAVLLDHLKVANQKAILEQAASLPEIFPTREHLSRFSSFNDALGTGELSVLWNMAKRTGENISSLEQLQEKLLHSCQTPNNSTQYRACFDEYVEKFGMLTHRRSLNQDEKESYTPRTELRSKDELLKDIQNVTKRLLMSPYFFYQLYTEGALVADGDKRIYRLSHDELLTRSYLTYTDRPPSLEDFEEFSDRDLTIKANRYALVESLFEDKKDLVKEKTGKFFEEWLLTNRTRSFNFESPAFQSFADDISIDNQNEAQSLATAMREELNDFATYTVFEKKGTYRDLLLGRESKPLHPKLAEIYGVDAVASEGEMLTLPAERAGVLTRAAFLASHRPKSNLIIRGVTIREELLCAHLGSPPDDFESADPPDLIGQLNSRELNDIRTAPTSCMGCHALINPLGYALEGFDVLGRYRESGKEKIYDEVSGELIAEVPLDTQVQPLIENRNETVNGALDLSRALADSPVARKCFARQYYRFAKGRYEERSESCSVDNLNYSLSSAESGSLEDMIQNYSLDDLFEVYVYQN